MKSKRKSFDDTGVALAPKDNRGLERARRLDLLARRYKSIVESQAEFICRWLPGGKLTFVNEAYSSYLGKLQNELLGEIFLPLTSLKDSKELNKNIRSLSRKNPVVTYDHRVTLPDGKICWLQWTNRAIYDKKDKFIEYQSVGSDISEFKRLSDIIYTSEFRFRRLFETAQDGILILDADTGCIEAINPFLIKMLGYSKRYLLGKKLWEIGVFKDIKSSKNAFLKLQKEGYIRYEDLPLETKSGKTIDVEFVSNVYVVEHKRVIQCNIRDITERKSKDIELGKLNRTFVALNHSDRAMMRAVNEQDYLEEICKIIVKDCGHAMVWIGFAENDALKTVRPVAQAGFERNYLKTIKVSWSNNKYGRGPTGTAVRTAKPSLCRNMLVDPKFKPWRKEAIKRGYSSSLVVPLIIKNRAIGAINIYSKNPDEFLKEEIKLLTQLADDLAYGITSIRLRIANKEVEAALKNSEKRFRSIIKNSPLMVFQQDINLCYTWIYNSIFGYSWRKIIGKTDIELIPGESGLKLAKIKRQVFNTGKGRREEIRINLNNVDLYYDITVEPLHDKSGEIVGVTGILLDITELKKAEQEISRLATFPEMNPNPVLEVDYSGDVLYSNPAARKLFTSLDTEDLRNGFLGDLKPILETFRNQNKEQIIREVLIGDIWFEQQFFHVLEMQRIRIYNLNITARKNITETLKKANDELELKVIQRASDLIETNTKLILENIERKKMERQIRITNSIMKLLTKFFSRKEYLNTIVKLLHGLSGCRCVGIRLIDIDRRIPYEAYLGFSREFFDQENLLSLDLEQCACIRTITGNFKTQDMKCMSDFGSFNCGNTTEFVNGLSESEKADFRGVCIKYGFTTVVIIPIRYKNIIIGAIHLADERKNRLRNETLNLIEHLTIPIGEGINKFTMTDSIQRSNEQLEKLFSSTHFCIVYLDAEFNFIRVNDAYARACGYPAEFFVGKNHFDLYPNEENEGIFRKVAESGEAYAVYAKPFIFPDHPEWGVTYWDWSLHPIKDVSEKVESLIFSLVDVTKSEFAEMELLKTQKQLVEVKRLSDIGTLASTVAHELRNPLAAIKMAAKNIKRKAENPILDRHISNIEFKVSESEQIIDNLLFYSRIRMPQYGKVSLCDIIDECMESAIDSFSKHEIVIDRDIDPLKEILIDADPLQMRELFSNLINNAFDAFLDYKGKLEIRCQLGENTVKVFIKDNGSGIEKEYLDKVFDPFFTTKAKGTGLGLSVCNQIVILHSGSIGIISQKNEGTTVTVELPIRQGTNVKKDTDN